MYEKLLETAEERFSDSLYAVGTSACAITSIGLFQPVWQYSVIMEYIVIGSGVSVD